jgi:glycopeptide antibiotics resistance protein
MEITFGEVQADLWPAAAVILAILVVIQWRKRYRPSYLICFSVFGAYILFVVEKAFFPLGIGISYGDPITQPEVFLSFINLVPFRFGTFAPANIVFIEMGRNAVLTIPFGFGVNFIASIKAKYSVWLAAAVGLGLEMGQLALCVAARHAYRVIDINDLLMNALGVLIGYGLFCIFAGLYVWAAQRLRLGPAGLVGYIYEVASRTRTPGQIP